MKLPGKFIAPAVAALAAAAIATPTAHAAGASSTASVTPQYEEIVQLYNVETGRCLDDSYGVNTGSCFGNGGYNVWHLDHLASLSVRIRNDATGWCLYEDAGGWIGVTDCNINDAAQTWWLETQGVKRNAWFRDVLDSDYNGNVYPHYFIDGDRFQWWGTRTP